MKFNKYLQNGPLVSSIGLGAWQLGINSGWSDMSEKQAINLVHEAQDYGVNFFDTAPNYGLGTSEERLGKALKKADRSTVVINTKFGHSVTGQTNFSADQIRSSIEGSLQRLQTDYVDSLIIHNPPMVYLDGNNNPHYEILERLIEEGKIKAYGASLDTNEEMQLLMNTTQAKVIEAFFNILHQDAANAFEKAKEQEVRIIVKIPLDSGWLSGKYHADSVFNDVRSRWSRADIVTRATLVEKIKKLSQDVNHLVQLAISFCLSYDAVATVIPGNLNPMQLQNNLKSLDYPVSDNLRKELEDFYKNEVQHLQLVW